MREEINDEQAVGKTVEGIYYSIDGPAVITFTDNTFTSFGVSLGHEACDVEIYNGKLDLFRFGDSKLIEAGVITSDELESRRESYHAASREARKASDRRQYERLRKKFGDMEETDDG